MSIKGSKELSKKLNQISKNATELSKGKAISFDDIFTTKFMEQNTDFSSIQEFLTASPENITTQEEFEKANETILDSFVSERTKFSTWKEMMTVAGKEEILRQLGL